MILTPIYVTIATFFSTFFGGQFALRFRDKLHLILGFSAGAVIGVAFFDLMPEAVGLASSSYDISTITTITACGFAAYLLLDRFATLHSHSDEAGDESHEHESALARRGILGAGSLSIHSFIDGIAIGLAFKVSASVGAIVAIAVLVHDFSDGINTVNLILKNGGSQERAFRWLIIDALAPIAGAASTLSFSLPETALGLVLAVFAGFFLYIGASDLLPESHHRHPTAWTTFAAVFGMGLLFCAVRVANF